MVANANSSMMPPLRFPEFRGSWRERRLSEFLAESHLVGSNGSIAKKLTVKLWGKGVVGKTEAIKGSASTQYYKRRAGQFIYSKLDFLNQAFGIIPDHLDGYESTVDLPCFDIERGINSRFLLEYVQRRDFYKRFGEVADGGRKAKRIQSASFLSFPILLPEDLREQQRIADCLTSLDDVISAQGRKLEALKEYKRGQMQQLFPREGESVPRLRFPEFRGGVGWQEATIASRSTSFSGGTPDTTDVDCYGGAIPFIRSAEIGQGVTQQFLTQYGMDTSAAKLVRRGDVLMALYGANSGDVAEARMAGAINQAVLCLRATDSNAFLFHALTARQDWIVSTYLQGGQGNLSAAIVKSIVLHFPRADEQVAVAECLSSVDAQIRVNAAKLDALRLHKAGLTQQLFPLPDAP